MCCCIQLLCVVVVPGAEMSGTCVIEMGGAYLLCITVCWIFMWQLVLKKFQFFKDVFGFNKPSEQLTDERKTTDKIDNE